MCGRYIFYDEKNQQLKEMIAAAREKMSPKEFAEISLFEVFPGQKAFAAVYDPAKQRSVIRTMQWGYSYAERPVINARSETCFSSSFFAGSLPCAIPASSYFEWTKTHQKYEFRTKHETIYLGALAHMENGAWHFVILTEEAKNAQAEIHPRQPLVFTYEDAKKWCASKHPTSMYANSIQERIQNKV
jgi:putative SOS response-associated peptidase YedK